MARTELPNGVILPAEYSDDWYEDMTSNLTKLDDVIGSDSEKLNADGVYFLRMSSAALTDSGTGNFSDLNSSYKIKTGDLVLDSGRKLYQIVSVDSTNSKFSVGNSLFKVTAESDLAPVAESGDYDDLTNKPNYGILRMTSETLSDSRSGAISNLNSDSKLAAGDYVLDAALKVFPITAVSAPSYTVGTSLFQITNALALAAVATSGSYDDLNHLPTYGITRFCSSAITDNSSVAFSAISSTDKIKIGDFLLDTAGKMYQITSVDTANQTVSVTTPLTQLAVDSSVMHLLGNETVAGLKTFSDYITSDGSVAGGEYTSNAKTNFWLMGNRDTEEVSGVLFDTYRQNTAQGTGIHILGLSIKENSVRYEGCRWGWYWDNNLNGYYFDFKPTSQGVNQAVKHNLGTSVDKWDTINGINPGALSLPDLNNGIDISGYITTPNAVSTYTPVVNGWVSIVLKSTSGALGCFATQGDFANGHYGSTALPKETEPCVMLSMPVIGGIAVNIYTKGSNAYVYSAKFFPCQGNV